MSDDIKDPEVQEPIVEQNDEFMYDEEEFEWTPPTLGERIKEWCKNALQYTAFGNIDNTREFTDFEYRMAYKIIEMYINYDNKISSWLFHYIDIKKFKLRWSIASGDAGIQGSYNPALWRTMTLSDIGYYHPDKKRFSIGGDPVGIINKSTTNGITYRVNTCIANTFLLGFNVFIHELTHAFQFGLPCTMPADSTWKDWMLFKVVMPIGYIFNRLVTAFIDNPLIDGILHKIDDIRGKSRDFDYNADKVHLPWLYKFTLEYDVDKEIEDNERLNHFCTMLQHALGSYEFVWNSHPDNPEAAKRYAKYTAEEIQEQRDRLAEQKAMNAEEYGQNFMDMAEELYKMFMDEAQKYIEIDKQKSN